MYSRLGVFDMSSGFDSPVKHLAYVKDGDFLDQLRYYDIFQKNFTPLR
jgi:hypothetical protein